MALDGIKLIIYNRPTMNLLNYIGPINNNSSSSNNVIKKNKITAAGSSNNYHQFYHQQQLSSNASLPASYFFGVHNNSNSLPSSNYGQFLTAGRFILLFSF